MNLETNQDRYQRDSTELEGYNHAKGCILTQDHCMASLLRFSGSLKAAYYLDDLEEIMGYDSTEAAHKVINLEKGNSKKIVVSLVSPSEEFNEIITEPTTVFHDSHSPNQFDKLLNRIKQLEGELSKENLTDDCLNKDQMTDNTSKSSGYQKPDSDEQNNFNIHKLFKIFDDQRESAPVRPQTSGHITQFFVSSLTP